MKIELANEQKAWICARSRKNNPIYHRWSGYRYGSIGGTIFRPFCGVHLMEALVFESLSESDGAVCGKCNAVAKIQTPRHPHPR